MLYTPILINIFRCSLFLHLILFLCEKWMRTDIFYNDQQLRMIKISIFKDHKSNLVECIKKTLFLFINVPELF